MTLPLRLLAPLALAAMGACTSSSDSSGGGSGSADGPEISFLVSSSFVDENDLVWNVAVDIEFGHNEDIDLSFYWTGSAIEFIDYTMNTPPPITIPAGVQTLMLAIRINEDVVGELDETITMTLVEPVNAPLGPITKHTITIQDEDEVAFPEVEPNDDHLTANVVGDMAPGLSWEISGDASPTMFDVFELTAIADSIVYLALDPASATTEAVLNILDQDGNVIAVIDDDQPGTTVTTTFAVTAGQKFFLAVTVEAFSSAYVLDAVGL